MKRSVTLASAAVVIALTVYFFLPEKGMPEGTKVDRLVVYKSKRRMMAYSQGELVRTYRVSLGGTPVGDKRHQGDQKTPEGSYSISGKGLMPNYHKYLRISYPDSEDKRAARLAGRDPGGGILIHGLHHRFSFVGKFHRWYDWTNGCIAVTDEEVAELEKAVKVGTPIDIHP